jgi:hypothetical protein
MTAILLWVHKLYSWSWRFGQDKTSYGGAATLTIGIIHIYGGKYIRSQYAAHGHRSYGKGGCSRKAGHSWKASIEGLRR